MFDDDNAYITDLCAAARSHVELYCGAYFGNRTGVKLVATDWFDLSRLPVAPIVAVESIEYFDAAGIERTLDIENYRLIAGCIIPAPGQSWPTMQSGSTIQISCSVGHEAVAPDVRHAMLLMISDMYERRDHESAVPFSTLDALLSNHREYP